MPIYLRFFDTAFPRLGSPHVRRVARALLLNEKGEVAIHTIHRDDMFGNQTYYETPGGGVDGGESFEEGLIRECEEETGYRIRVQEFLGEVVDEYALIGRTNINRYYLATIVEKVGVHFASQGDSYIEKTDFYPPEVALSLYRSMSEEGVSGLVKRRELPFLEALSKRK